MKNFINFIKTVDLFLLKFSGKVTSKFPVAIIYILSLGIISFTNILGFIIAYNLYDNLTGIIGMTIGMSIIGIFSIIGLLISLHIALPYFKLKEKNKSNKTE
jgi:hypothetical protein